MKSYFYTPLDKRDLNDNEFVLLKPLIYYSELLGGFIEVEKGFVSDGASTPRVPLVYWLYGDRAHHEAVVHDRLYRSPKHTIIVTKENNTRKEIFIPKKLADDIFFEAMECRDKGFFVRWGMYSGVYLGGFSSYKSGPSRFKIMEV